MLVVFLILLAPAFVSAQYYSSYSGFRSYYSGSGSYYSIDYMFSWIEYNVGPYFQLILGGSPEFLFEKILLFFVIISVIFVVLKRIPIFQDNLAATWIVTIAVALLSTRFFGDIEYIKNILTPYEVLGVSLSAAIPFIIFFFFVQSFESGVVRRILWVFFIVVFLGVWGSRYDELGQLSWIYFITGVAALIFLIGDGTIRRIMIKEQMRQLGIQSRDEFERKIRRQIEEAREDLTKNVITESQYSYIVHRLQKQLKTIRKN